MKYKIGVFFVSLVFFACSNDAEKGELISMDDFAGETGELLENNTQIEDTLMRDNDGPLSQFLASKLANFDTVSHAEFNPIDRFSYSQKLKIEFKSKTDVDYGKDKKVTPRASFYYYSYYSSSSYYHERLGKPDLRASDASQLQLL